MTRGLTPRPRSGAAAGRSYPTPLSPRPDGAAERRSPASEVRGRDERSYPVSEARGGRQEEIPHTLKPEARGGGREELPHAMAAQAQEGLEELSHVEGQEGRW